MSIRIVLASATLFVGLCGCHILSPRDRWIAPDRARITRVAESPRQWTGLAISGEGRIFVNFPLWSESQEFAVGELQRNGTVIPFPNRELNDWAPDKPAADHFVCVQALLADERGRLWVLDPANPRFQGVVSGGPKLVVIDMDSGEVERTYRFGPEIAPPSSYLNDLRLDLETGYAYITDSGQGALVVLDLESGKSRRLLDGHPSTQAESITLTIEGKPWLIGGQPPQIHADGIALSANRARLYYQALSGTVLYTVPTKALRDEALTAAQLAARVSPVTRVGPSDGLLFGPDGAVYLTSLEENAIRRVWPESDVVELVVQDRRISWPDSCARGADGKLYFTTAQIHRGASPPRPYAIYRIDSGPE